MKIQFVRHVSLTSIAALCLALSPRPWACSGCENSTFMEPNGAAQEIWQFNPDPGSDPAGSCTGAQPPCGASPCVFKGMIQLKNNSGATRDVYDADGNYLGSVGNGVTGAFGISSITVGCGVEWEPGGYATEPGVGGDKPHTSGIVFGCSICG